jgi:peroxiredoxin
VWRVRAGFWRGVAVDWLQGRIAPRAAQKPEGRVRRNALVILGLVVGITLMLWSGVMAYRERRAAQMQSPQPVALVPEGSNSGTVDAASADPNSPQAQGLPDLRGKLAPGFTLQTPDGKAVSLADYKGKAVLINFWATWCAPCKVEMPWLIDLQKQYAAQGFTVLGVSEDDPPYASVAEFAKKAGVNYPVVVASDAVNRAYGNVDGLPTSYYIGRDGKIVAETAGLISKDDIEANIKKILASKG